MSSPAPDGERIGNVVDHSDQHIRIAGNQLTAALVIKFVPVISGRIVRGRNHHAARRVTVPHGKRKFRGGTQAVENESADALGGQNTGCFQAEFPAHTPVIMRNHHAAPGHITAAVFFQILRKTKRCAAHGIAVDPVGPSAHQSPHAAGSEGNIRIEPIVNLRVVFLHFFQFCPRRFVHRRACQPFFICFPILHFSSPCRALPT